MSTDYTALVEVALARYKLACDEMDRLTAGNPGNTWRWSIPANPDRDSDLILSASAEDVPRLASAVEALREQLAAAEAVLTEARDIARSSSVPLGIPEGAHFRSLLRSVESTLADYRTGDTNA